MAAYNYHNGNDQVVLQLNELFGDKLNLDIIKTVAQACQFDVNKSSNELLEITSIQPEQRSAIDTMADFSPVHSSKKSKKAVEIERVIKEINDGYKVLILVRGMPGSGKTSLAKSILENTIGYSNEMANKVILSTDDFFLKNGVYQRNVQQLNEAHGWNHQRAFNVMSKGYSPVIIDNTNTQMWEMKPYAMMATDYGYILEILEPDTHWCFNDKELEKRNIHGVPKSTIKNMLERYQKNVTPMKLLTAYDCKYKLQKPPQYRLHPPLNQTSYTAPKNGVLKPKPENTNLKFAKFPQIFSPVNHASQPSTKEATNFMDFHEPSFTLTKKIPNRFDTKPTQSSSIDDILMDGDSSFLKTPVLKPMHTTKIKQSSSLFDSINAWGVDEMALRSWDIVTPLKGHDVDPLAFSPIVIDDDEETVETTEMSTNTEDEDFYYLRNILCAPLPKTLKVMTTCSRDINRNLPLRPQGIRKKIMVDKSCLAEDFLDDHSAHIENLARVFPNVAKNTIKYWYEKCNSDFDCTIELLLAERDEVINVIIDDESSDSEKESIEQSIAVDSDSSSSASETVHTPNRGAKPKRKSNSISSDDSKHLKKHIEGKFLISDDHYSEKLLKIKQRRYGETSATNATPEAQSPKLSSSPLEMELDENKLYCDDIEWEEVCSKLDNLETGDQVDNVETVELNIGDHFVKQLEDNFGDPNLLYPKGFQPVVQMPVALARQLYTFYIESVYQQMEAQNSVMDALVKEDEDFAKKLQENEEKGLVEEPKSQGEPTDIPDIIREQKELSRWQRVADKWKEDTPDTLASRLTRDKLFKTFPSIDRNTLVEILHAHDNVYQDTIETLLMSTTPENIHGDIDSIKDPPINTTTVTEMWEAHECCKKDIKGSEGACSAINYREEANGYLEKRTILYEKAQKYYQSGMKEVAQFYSGLASKQTRLYEQANSLAATAFLDEHSKRLEDFNTIDLHFLYVKEAIPTLDIFLDRNINLLRLSSSKNTEFLQIITGRGKNSKNGVAKIKPAVLGRIKERKISYQHLNPGLIKIKVSKLSKVTSEL